MGVSTEATLPLSSRGVWSFVVIKLFTTTVRYFLQSRRLGWGWELDRKSVRRAVWGLPASATTEGEGAGIRMKEGISVRPAPPRPAKGRSNSSNQS